MKSKYKTYFKRSSMGYNIELRISKSEYVFMYCKKTIKDFDRKAKRIRSESLFDIIKISLKLFCKIKTRNRMYRALK